MSNYCVRDETNIKKTKKHHMEFEKKIAHEFPRVKCEMIIIIIILKNKIK